MRRYTPLARSLVKPFARTREPPEDLRQVAFVGLLLAIDRFDPQRGEFPAFAAVTIRGELKRHLRDHAWAMRLPRRLQERYLLVLRATTELAARGHGSPTSATLAAHTGLSIEAVNEALTAGRAATPRHLDAPVGTDGDSLADTVGGPDPALLATDRDPGVLDALDTLTDRERAIVHLRYQEDLTQTEIAVRLGISQVRVSQLIARALRRLQDAAA